VTGQDSHIWAAYIFLDSFNEYDDAGILDDCEDQRKEVNMALDEVVDPFTGWPVTPLLIEPRGYFLRVLEMLSRRARKEWYTTVSGILKNLDKTVSPEITPRLIEIHG